jgi:hypothetical protein
MDGVIELMNHSIQSKLNSDYSFHYKKDLVSLGKFFEKFLTDGGKKDLKLKDLTKGLMVEFINSRPEHDSVAQLQHRPRLVLKKAAQAARR